jgi:nucleoside-diphosphate-sugar epimerase
MHILILGAAGMVGRKLLERLRRIASSAVARSRARPCTTWSCRSRPRTRPSRRRRSPPISRCPGEAEKLVAERPDVIFHLAAIVSGEAEADFDKGYRINLDGTRMLFDAVRLIGDGYKPRLVFTSSIAVFGAPFPRRSTTNSSRRR